MFGSPLLSKSNIYSNIQFGQFFHCFAVFRTCGLVYVFAHRVVFEENRAVLVVDVDQAGDHHKDQEAENCNHNHLRTIREVQKKVENLTTIKNGKKSSYNMITIRKNERVILWTMAK